MKMPVQLLPERIAATDIQDDLSQGPTFTRCSGGSAAR
jgi:hypothetical protein